MQENPYGIPDATQQSSMRQTKHSGPGIASFLLSMSSGIALLVLFGIAGYMESRSPTGIDKNDPSTAVLGLALIAAGMAQFLAAILGLVGLFQADRKNCSQSWAPFSACWQSCCLGV
ncbi:MAG TPA: hypothetical protein PLY87_07510 [Planctomycetaceae bacterium]|nr:hypothetical protein [Planctomycetaceae bacterium]HQZ64905.1 hypothetical protein [Planctomycetaceae bacterium]